jgi:hypothetical protein
MDWRIRIISVLGGGVILGAAFLRSVTLALVGLAVVMVAFVVDRVLKARREG